MDAEEVPTAENKMEQPFVSSLDFLMLSVVCLAVFYYLLRSKKKPESVSINTYTIQPTTLTTQTNVDNSFIKKLKSSGRSLVVFYGSQTGTGEEFAGRIAKEGNKYGLKGMVADPEECDMEELRSLKDIPNSLAVFCLATYGEGDPTDNAMDFYDWLQNGVDDLTGLNYAVFGLGNKTYEHYNEIAINVDKKLEELGANRIFELGLGDDDANIEDDFITWKDKFWPAVCEYFGIEPSGDDENARQYKLTVHTEVDHTRVFKGEMVRLYSYKNQRPPYDQKNPFLATLKVNRELHKSGDRSCMHIELNTEGSKLSYDAGDHAAIYAENDPTSVNKIGELLDVDLETIITLTNLDEDSNKKHPFPCPCSYRTALTHYLDITSNPRTHVLKELAEYASDPKEQEMLRLMASTSSEGKQLYSSWIGDDNRNIIHILEDLPSVKPPLDHLCELLPRLQPRYYSISSSGKLYPTSVHITAVKVEYTTPTSRLIKGVCTGWLAQKIPSNDDDNPVKIPIFIRRSQFKLPSKTETPILMIGPGTGFAPFRGFIQERNLSLENGKKVGETILYYGCRKKSEDFIYEEEINNYISKGFLTVHFAFSRDQKEKVYVTHLLEKNADEVWRVIGENNGHLYICGDAKNMAKDVHNIVLKVIQEKGNMSEENAVAYIKKMENQRRYCTDVWS